MRNYLKRMEREGVQRVKMFLVITGAYVLFWGPLFFVTLVHHPLIVSPMGYEVSARPTKQLGPLSWTGIRPSTDRKSSEGSQSGKLNNRRTLRAKVR